MQDEDIFGKSVFGTPPDVGMPVPFDTLERGFEALPILNATRVSGLGTAGGTLYVPRLDGVPQQGYGNRFQPGGAFRPELAGLGDAAGTWYTNAAAWVRSQIPALQSGLFFTPGTAATPAQIAAAASQMGATPSTILASVASVLVQVRVLKGSGLSFNTQDETGIQNLNSAFMAVPEASRKSAWDSAYTAARAAASLAGEAAEFDADYARAGGGTWAAVWNHIKKNWWWELPAAATVGYFGWKAFKGRSRTSWGF